MNNGLNRLLLLLLLIAAATDSWAQESANQNTDSLKNVSLPEVVATGTRSETDIRLLPLTVSVLTEKELTQAQNTNVLPTLMDQVPGMFITSRGVLGYSVSTGGSGGIKIRGIGSSPNTDVLVLIDGLPQYAGLYGHPISDAYQTYMTERVEVIRGPGTMLYGSNAMGGVINITTHNPKRDTIMSGVHLRGGSYYTLDAGINTTLRRKGFNMAAGFNYSRTDGHRDNMSFSEYNGFARVGYDWNKHWGASLTGNIAYFSTANPGTITAPIFDSRYDVLRGMTALSVNNHYEHYSGSIRAYYNGGKHKINEGHQAGAPALTADYNHTDFMAGLSAYETVEFFQGNTTTFGFDYQHFGGHAWNEDLSNGNRTDLVRKAEYELAAYVDFRQHALSWMVIDAGVRLDWHSRCGLSYAPQAGLSFILPENTELKALVSKGFRNPTIKEMYMYKPKNADLKPVSMWNYEISYRQSLVDGRLRLGANIFYLHAKNNIETRMIEGAPKNVNTGELKNAGAEVELSFEIIRGLTLAANYSYLYMHNPTIAAPEHKAFVALNYHHERFTIGTSLQAIVGLYKAVGDNPEKENFVLWNAHASYRIWKGLWAQLKAENMLAQEYEINLGFPMPKTTVLGGFEWRF